MRTTVRHLFVIGLPLVILALQGCGSSKPSYCSAVSTLKQSVQQLKNVDVVQNGTSSLKTAVDKIKTDASSVASAAKSDFPSETSALKSSVDALSQSVRQLTEQPSAAQIATVAGAAASSVTAVNAFTSSVSSKCG